MKLNSLKPSPGSKRDTIRKGRGTATGRGKTAGRGQDGQKSRSGGGVRIGFEGGQMPLTRRVPKRGFSNAPFKKEYAIVNVGLLEKLGLATADKASLRTAGVIRNSDKLLKILAEGELTIPVNVTADKVSGAAAAKITAAGGTVTVIPPVVKNKYEAAGGKAKANAGDN